MVEHDAEATTSRGDAKSSAGAPPTVDPNYQYWRDHGGEWADAYDQRKKRQVLYHIQELMLTHYMLQHAAVDPKKPLMVLEFGCGVGRHLRNLTRLPGVDAYGYDQSQAMAQGVLRWAGRAWFDSHITVGLPTGSLPYPDKHFDIVYSAEVLVHVRPEHLDGILKEMVRVCRGHILHLETSEHVPLVTGEHSGCWRHDLPAAYARLGLECAVLPSGYLAHQPFRVVVGKEPEFTWAPAIIEMYRRLERDMDAGFTAAAVAEQQRVEELHRTSGELSSQLAQHAEALAAQSALVQQRTAEVGALRGSLAAEQAALTAGQARLAEVEQSLHQSTANARNLAENNESLRAQLEAALQATRETVARSNAQIAALIARVHELEGDVARGQEAAAGLIEERNTFVARVSRHLRV